MVNYSNSSSSKEQMNRIFHSLSDPTRRDILERLAKDNLSVTQIAEPYAMSLPAISKHLKILEQAELISREKTGREYRVQIEANAFRSIAEYIKYYQKFWERQLQSLERLLNKESSKKQQNEKQTGNSK